MARPFRKFCNVQWVNAPEFIRLLIEMHVLPNFNSRKRSFAARLVQLPHSSQPNANKQHNVWLRQWKSNSTISICDEHASRSPLNRSLMKMAYQRKLKNNLYNTMPAMQAGSIVCSS